MASVYSAIEESSASDEEKQLIRDALNDKDQQEWADSRIDKICDRLCCLEKAVTELRCKVFQLPMNYDKKGALCIDIGGDL